MIHFSELFTGHGLFKALEIFALVHPKNSQWDFSIGFWTIAKNKLCGKQICMHYFLFSKILFTNKNTFNAIGSLMAIASKSKLMLEYS